MTTVQNSQPEGTLSAGIEDLQVKIAFLDDLVESLNDLVASQGQTIADLQQQMQILYQRIDANKVQSSDIAAFDPANEVPPHY